MEKKYGGNLVLYPDGIDKNPVTITSKFNRLVLMETNNNSIHGVTKVLNKSPRRCVSNYYFSDNSTNGTDYKHVTSFFSFKKESLLKKTLLSIDRNLRGRFSSVIKSTINYENWHKRN